MFHKVKILDISWSGSIGQADLSRRIWSPTRQKDNMQQNQWGQWGHRCVLPHDWQKWRRTLLVEQKRKWHSGIGRKRWTVLFLTFFSKLYYIPFFTLYVSLHSLLFPPLTFFDHSSICLWHPAVQNSGQTLDNCVILNNSLRRNIFANKIRF